MLEKCFVELLATRSLVTETPSKLFLNLISNIIRLLNRA
ncbi:hypothetical protein LEP1GSC008_2261 [Leptospira kirschneri serovar Bulgarica str. Nikolaevo]|uniref:Uncharacterized protein n=2 Tax=Leptospira kirschneri TaxID=29507 RepID=A0A0E2BGY9_9LEPT|nr:hypothetical protein LEP1GSC081_2971 [Leptospira kirschneri str. H1]EMK25765.1 hypothetical protein LEP1GSC008_2261 [Leptospira kirschneri serovar Bulgarica str. Nikolaevo]